MLSFILVVPDPWVSLGYHNPRGTKARTIWTLPSPPPPPKENPGELKMYHFLEEK